MSDQQTDELRGLACHTANLEAEVVKGIIQRSEFNPKLAKHAQCAALHCFKSQFTQKKQKGVINTANMLRKIKTNHIIFSSLHSVNKSFCSADNLFMCDTLEGGRRKSLCCCRGAAACWEMWRWTRGIHNLLTVLLFFI